jgi:hypothetical protein
MPLEQVQLRPIGYVHTRHTSLAETPIQTSRNPDERGRLVVLDQYADALDGLEEFDTPSSSASSTGPGRPTAVGPGRLPATGCGRSRSCSRTPASGSGCSPPAPRSAPTTSP